jgi:hypothetical protein
VPAASTLEERSELVPVLELDGAASTWA